MIAQLANAWRQQGTVVEKLSRNVNSITQETEQSANGTEALACSSIALLDPAASLK
jgi:methyl-accepting chemotaxis protein